MGEPGSFRPRLQRAVESCLTGRASHDVAAMCLRKPEGECIDALRAQLNAGGPHAGHLALREGSTPVARTDLVVHDLPSGMPLAVVEAKALFTADAVAPRYDGWSGPSVAADVAKLKRHTAGERFFLEWTVHWVWIARPELHAYPRLVRGLAATREGRDDDALADRMRRAADATSTLLGRHGLSPTSVHLAGAGEHPDLGAAVVTAHLAELTR